jgi:hypothetical protein
MRTRTPYPLNWAYSLMLAVVLIGIRFRSPATLGTGFFLIWIVLSALVIVWGVRNMKRRRAWVRFYAGQCIRCGYDLRATPGKCPECGAVPTREQAQYITP